MMTRYRRRRHSPLTIALAVAFAVVALFSLAIDIAAHLWVIALIAAVPLAYAAGYRHARGLPFVPLRRSQRRARPVRRDTPEDAPADRSRDDQRGAYRSRLLSDPRSGAREL